MTLQESGQPSRPEPGRGVRRRVALQKVQGNVGGEVGEDGQRSWPVRIEQRLELIGGGNPGLDVIVAHPNQGLQLAGHRIHGPQPAQAAAVGAQIIGQAIAVPRVRLRMRRTPSRARRIKSVWMDGNHWMASLHQPFHDQTARAFDRDGQCFRSTMVAQSLQGVLEVCLMVANLEMLDDSTLLIEHRHIVGLAGPIPTHIHEHTSVPSRDNEDLLGAEGRSRRLIGRPSPRLVPNAGLRSSAHRGRQYSCWPSAGERARPCLGGHRSLRPSLNQVAPLMVEQ